MRSYANKGHTRYPHVCLICQESFSTTRDDSRYCSDCLKQPQLDGHYEYSGIRGRLVWQHRIIAEKILGRRLVKNELVHHIDLDKGNNSLDNLMILSCSEHTRLHRYLGLQRAIVEKSTNVNVENCWKTLIVPMTTAWLETANAKVIKLSEIGQSAAEPLNAKAHEESSEAMHDTSVTGNAVDEDMVQTTTVRASES